MNSALWAAKTGLDAQQTRMAVTSNNLANVSTNGFKKGRAVFEDLMYQNVRQVGGSTSQDTEAPSGLSLGTGVRIVATAHCAPPQNTLTTTERDTCGGWLDRELTLVQPGLRSVLALGAVGWGALLAAGRRLGWTIPRPKPRFGHGAVAHLGLPDGREVRLVGCYHVSQQNTFTGKLTQEMLDAAIALAGEPERP